MMNYTRFILIIIITNLTIFDLSGQNWHWEWVKTNTKNGSTARNDVLHSDFLNNIYCRTAYDTAIYIYDTSFHHPAQYSSNANCAISKYDNRGGFINALDLYTLSGEHLHYPRLLTDSALNIYLCSPFSYKVFIKDTFLTAAYTPYQWQPDVFLAKLSPDYDLLWSGLITSDVQDALRGMVMSNDGHIFISCVHMANANPHQVNYLNQDTSAPYITPMNSLTKIDMNGNLVWKKEIRSEFLGTDTRDLIIGDDGLLYLMGTAYGHISIDNDTIFHPYYPEVKTTRFLTVFNQSGELLNGYFFDWDIWLWEIKVSYLGDIFVSGSISDTAIIGSDTIVVPEGITYKIIGRFNSELNPIWYQIMESNSSGRIFLDNQNIIFCKGAKGTIQIADTILQLGNYYETIIGEFNEEGQLINLISTNSSKDIASIFNLTDNCTNPLIGGYFTGTAIFGNDTITSKYGSISDAFIAKLVRNESPLIDIGPDSIYCEEYTIYGPDGFQYYSWNDSITNQYLYSVTESGNYYFACSNDDGCWAFDTINIGIHPGFEIDLGSDTTIRENDTIMFAIPDLYESYLWSDGTTLNDITIIGNDYGIGTFPIWVEVTDDPCIETDTIHLIIKSEFGIDEIISNSINIYPNPFENEITIEIKPNSITIEIYDLNGISIFLKNINQVKKTEQIKLERLNKGIYFLKIKTREQNFFKKIIKI
jgi:hypothetical protein